MSSERWTGLKGKPESANMRFLLEQGKHRFPGPGYNTWHDRVLKEERGHLRLIRDKINDYFGYQDEADTDPTLQGPLSPEGVGDSKNQSNLQSTKNNSTTTTTTTKTINTTPQSGSVLGTSILAQIAQKKKESASNNAGGFKPGETAVFNDTRPISSPRERVGRKPVEIDEDKFSSLSEQNQRRLFNIWPQVGNGWNDRRVQQTLYEKGRDVEESPLRTFHPSSSSSLATGNTPRRPNSARSSLNSSSLFSAPPIRPNQSNNSKMNSSDNYYNSLVADEKKRQEAKLSSSLMSLVAATSTTKTTKQNNITESSGVGDGDDADDFKSPAAAQLRAPSTSREIGFDGARGQQISQSRMFPGNSYRQSHSEVARGAASILSVCSSEHSDRIANTPNWNYNRRVMAPANPEPVLSRRAESLSRAYAAQFKTTASREEEATAHLLKKINDLEQELASQQHDRFQMQEHILELKNILFQQHGVAHGGNNNNNTSSNQNKKNDEVKADVDKQNTQSFSSVNNKKNIIVNNDESSQQQQQQRLPKPSRPQTSKIVRSTNVTSGNGGRGQVRFTNVY